MTTRPSTVTWTRSTRTAGTRSRCIAAKLSSAIAALRTVARQTGYRANVFYPADRSFRHSTGGRHFQLRSELESRVV